MAVVVSAPVSAYRKEDKDGLYKLPVASIRRFPVHATDSTAFGTSKTHPSQGKEFEGDNTTASMIVASGTCADIIAATFKAAP